MGPELRHHEHLLCTGKQLQDIVDELWIVVDHRDGHFPLAQRRGAKNADRANRSGWEGVAFGDTCAKTAAGPGPTR